MFIREVFWRNRFIDKLLRRHNVTIEETEDVLFGSKHVLRIEKGKIKGEDVFEAFGQTQGGRFLVVFFINKSGAAMPISAREMTKSERRYYEGHKK